MKRSRFGVICLLTAVGAALLTPAAALAGPTPAPDSCGPRLKVKTASGHLCSWGPDQIPGLNPADPVKPLPATVATARTVANPVVCEGDGVSGKRVETLYVREQQTATRYSKFLPTFRAWSHEIDAAFNDSAAQTGASRHVRFVSAFVDGRCQVNVKEVVVPNGSLVTWESLIPVLENLGYKSNQRKYLLYTEGTTVCGVGTNYGDDKAALSNLNNTNTGYARVDSGCWGFNAAAHELGHTFGAVQTSAPNANGAHCLDEWDLMCYGAETSVVCADKDMDRLFDCNHDDYFNTNPPSGSYLATHWNTANSDWLIKSAAPDPREGPRDGQAVILTNASTENAIDVVDGSTANLAYVSNRAKINRQASQQWLFRYDVGWLLQNAGSKKCADSAQSGTTPGTKVLQYTCNSQQGMRWDIYPQDDGSYALINQLNGLALTDSGTYPAAVTLQNYTGAMTQRWFMEAAPLLDGTYRIQAEAGGRDLDITDCKTTDGADIRMWYRLNSPCQKWQVTRLAANTYKIIDANSNKSLDVTGCSTADGAVVELWTYTGLACQRWQIEPNGRGGMRVLAVNSGKSLDLAGCNPNLGADVIIYPYAGSTCQRWYFEPLDPAIP